METRDDELVNLKVFTNSENLRWSFNPSTIFLRNTITETPAKKKKKNPYCNPTFISSTNICFLYKDTIPLKRSVFVVVHQTPQYAHTALQGLSWVSFITYSHLYGKQGEISHFHMAHTCFPTYQLPLLFLAGRSRLRSPFSPTCTELSGAEVSRHFLNSTTSHMGQLNGFAINICISTTCISGGKRQVGSLITHH